MISKTLIASFLHCELCYNHITILPIWIDDPLHCSGMIEVWPLRAKRCPRPREHQLLSSFFQFLRPPLFQSSPHPTPPTPSQPALSFLLLCPSCSVTTVHLLCQPDCHLRFLSRSTKKSTTMPPRSLFCLFLFQKSQLHCRSHLLVHFLCLLRSGAFF